MTQNSAQNPEDQAACQSGGQQTSAEGAHAQSGQQAAKAVSQPSAPAPEPSGAAQAAASAAADAPQAEGSAPKASRPVTISAKGFRGMFGNSGKEGKPAASAKPAESAPQSAAPGFADKIFDAASIVGPLALLLIMLAQAWPALMGHSLYCPREAAGILAFTQTAQSGMWLAPAGDGLAQWPVFFWFLRGIEALLTKAAPQFAHLLFPLAAMAGTLLCLVAVWVLGRVAGLDRRAALAGGMLLLCAPIFAPLSTFTGPEALAAAVTLLSLACLCHGWQQPGTTISLPLGFALAALAGLTGGLFYLLLPVLASLAFLLWRCGFRRAQKADGLVGFVLMLGIIGCWLAVVMLWHQPDGYLKNLGTQLVTWPITKATWWKPLAFAALGLLPWLAVICGVSWARVLRTAPADLAASRKEKAGMAFLWIALVFACLLSIFAADMVGAAVCTASLAALLLGKALLRLPPAGAKLFYITLTESQRTAVLGLKALPVLGGIGIVAAVLLARLVRRGAHGGTSGSLVMCAVIAVILAQPASLMLMPQLEKTPEAQVKSLSAILTPAPAAPAVLAPEATPAPAPEAPAAAPADTPKLEPAAPAEKPAPVQEPAAPAATQPAEASAPQTAAPAAPTTPAETPAAAPAPTPADAAKELAKEVVKEAAPAAPSEQAPAAQPEQPKEAPKAPAN